ncbi:MAG: glycosyltransferase family 4 protein [Planctomycetota bacterium]
MADQSPTTNAAEVLREQGPAKGPIRAAWIAGEKTLEDLALTIQPLAISLMDELVELSVLCPGGADASSLPSPPIEIVRYGRVKRGPFGGRAAERLASEVVGRKIQLLHALDAAAAPLARRLARAAGVNYVISSYALGDGRRLGRLDEHAKAVLAASERIQRDLMERRVISAERIYLLRPGVIRVSRPTCFRNPENSVAIIAGGAMDDFGCFDALLGTFAQLKARSYDCVYFIIGQGRAERRLRERCEKLGLAGEVTFVERQPPWQLTGILKAADIYISPVRAGGLDFQSLRAMAAGVPVLSVSDPASDFLKDGRTSSQFKPGDTSELTMRLLSLLEDRPAAMGLAENALEYLRRHHNPAQMSARTAEIYRRVVAEAAAEKQQARKKA